MGQDVAARVFSRADRQCYREKVRVCLDVFALHQTGRSRQHTTWSVAAGVDIFTLARRMAPAFR